MKNRIFVIFLLISNLGLAQSASYKSEEIRINNFVEGTLLSPSTAENAHLVILIQGSGPTDRNGNQSFMKNDSFKKLAAELAENGIASFRFDKRILNMQKLGLREEDISFDDFITDATSVIKHFQNSPDFEKLIVLGHSQGSLVGMVTAKEQADAFISIAGAAEPIDSIIIEQIGDQMPGLKQNVQESFNDMRETGSSENYNPMLEMIFRPSVQPFILSWMKYDPREEVSKLDIPILLINGTNDLQISQKEAEKLKQAQPDSQLVILEKMNHVFRKIEGDALENSKSYNSPGLPLHPELTPVIVEFIKNLK